MVRSVDPSFIAGEIKSPSSKSMTQRAIAAAMLAKGSSIIKNPSYCNDSLAAMSIARGFGAKIVPEESLMYVTGRPGVTDNTLNCGESGLAIRMFSPIAALFPEKIVMLGKGSLRNRPMQMIGDALIQLGAMFESTGGFLPLTIQGPLKGGRCEIDGSVSSQLLTGLLMALPLTAEDSEIFVTNLKSKPYVDMTMKVLRDFGITVSHEDYKLFTIRGRQAYPALPGRRWIGRRS